MTRAGRRLVLLAATWAIGSGCVYYNGVYNAQEAARLGERRLRADNETEAATQFQLSAAKAESVLVRHPTSKWRARALYLAGRGAALGGQCEQATVRLNEYLTTPGEPAVDRDRARVALASCEVRSAKLAEARARLDSLVDSPDAPTARQARLWASRAALAQGDRDAVERYLGSLDGGALPWELLSASLNAREFVRVESLLVQRASRGDYRDDVTRVLRDLWADGRVEAAERIVATYDAARIRDANRAAMHFALGDLSLRSGLDSVARRHLFASRTLAGRDTVMERESAARLAFLPLPRVASVRELDTLLARQDSAVLRTLYARRTTEQVLLLRLFEAQEDVTGASTYLAAEVARDSLRAPVLAQSLFLRVAREVRASPLVPHAWYAASLITTDSAGSWRRRILAEYATSSVAARLRGEDPAASSDYVSAPALLTLRWTETVRTWSDSVRKLRLPPKAAGPVRAVTP